MHLADLHPSLLPAARFRRIVADVRAIARRQDVPVRVVLDRLCLAAIGTAVEADALAARRWYTGEEYRVETALVQATLDMERAKADEERAACKATLERVRRVMDAREVAA